MKRLLSLVAARDALWRWLQRRFTSTSFICAAFAVNEGSGNAAREPGCADAFSAPTHAVVDQSSANVHLVRKYTNRWPPLERTRGPEFKSRRPR